MKINAISSMSFKGSPWNNMTFKGSPWNAINDPMGPNKPVFKGHPSMYHYNNSTPLKGDMIPPVTNPDKNQITFKGYWGGGVHKLPAIDEYRGNKINYFA